MLNYIKTLFGIKPKETAVEATAPYKIETVAVTPVAEQAVQAVVESMAPAKKKPPAKKAPTAKKPRAPKASK
jgi:hypothetical protein